MTTDERHTILAACEILKRTLHAIAVEKGWWEAPERGIMEQLCLFHTEISEAAEEYRAGHPLEETRESAPGGKPEGFTVELADVLIRIFDTAGRYDLPIGECLIAKHHFNLTRPARHGGKLA